MNPPISPQVSAAATAIVLCILPGQCPKWRQDQIYTEATTTIGMTGNKEVIADLKAALKHRGKIELEIEAIEDVLIKHWRIRQSS